MAMLDDEVLPLTLVNSDWTDERMDGLYCSVPSRFRVNPSSSPQASDTDFVQNSALQGQRAPLVLVKSLLVVGDNQLRCRYQWIDKQPLLLHALRFNLTGGRLSTRVDPDLSNTSFKHPFTLRSSLLPAKSQCNSPNSSPFPPNLVLFAPRLSTPTPTHSPIPIHNPIPIPVCWLTAAGQCRGVTSYT